MIYIIELTLLLMLVVICFEVLYLRRLWIAMKDINIEGKPVIIYREHPKPRAGGLTKRPVKVNSDTSIWEREQDGHARSTAEIV